MLYGSKRSVVKISFSTNGSSSGCKNIQLIDVFAENIAVTLLSFVIETDVTEAVGLSIPSLPIR